MKKEQLTDRIIRNKLKYHTSASPDHLWGAIEAELPVDKKDRGGFWWFAGGFLGLTLILTATFFFFNGSETNTVAVNKEEKRAIAQELSSTESTSAIALNKAEAKTNNPLQSTLKTEKFSEKEERETSNKALAAAKTAISKTNEQPDTPINAASRNEKWAISAISKKNNDAQATNSNAIVSIPQTAETKVSQLSIADAVETKAFASLDLLSKEILPLGTKEKELDWPSLMQDPKCATFGKWLKLHFYGDAYISPDIAFRKLESKDADYEGYAANRKDTESQLLSYSTGLRFSVVSNYGLSLRTGIVYSQINEKFRYQDENTERTIIEEVEDDEGNLISSDTIVENGTHFITTYNRYRMLDVPLLIGYEVSFKKFSLSMNSGVYANLISRQKGNFLSPDLKPVTFSSDARDTYPAFRERLNLSIYGSVAVYFNLNEDWQLMVEPQVRYYLDPMTISNYMVEQKYITTGLITGLRYRF